jgi:hypothetical protein
MHTRSVFRKAVKIIGIFAGCCFILAAAFAVWYVIEFYPRTADSFEINSAEQPTRILVATQGSEFKSGLVAAVCDRLRQHPVHIKVIDVGKLDDVDSDEWNKILIINTAMMNLMNRSVRRFVSRGRGLDRVLLLVTSGGADFKPADLAVDALSGASRKRDINRLADLIVDWTAGAGQGRWTAGDQFLALEYFLQVDVAAACAAIDSDRDRYLQLYPDLEGRLNRVGYDFMRRGLLVDALQAFDLNRELFPESWNVYDSYAEALLASGDREGSITNYRKSLELNPGHEAGRQRLTELVSHGR